MAIEIRIGGKHRCTDCGAKWWRNLPEEPKWICCPNPEGHPCPKCAKAAAKPVDPNRHECKTGMVERDGTMWRLISGRAITLPNITHCPYCGTTLPEPEGA